MLQRQGVMQQPEWLPWMFEQGFGIQVPNFRASFAYLDDNRLELTVDQLEITSNQFQSHESINNMCSWRACAHRINRSQLWWFCVQPLSSEARSFVASPELVSRGHQHSNHCAWNEHLSWLVNGCAISFCHRPCEGLDDTEGTEYP